MPLALRSASGTQGGKTSRKENMPKKRKYYETGFRLDRKEKEALRAKGLYVYSRRDNGKESTIEPNVAVDFMGTLVTNFPIPFRKRGPTAYVIYQGDSYLNSRNAQRVYDVKDLSRTRKKKGGGR